MARKKLKQVEGSKSVYLTVVPHSNGIAGTSVGLINKLTGKRSESGNSGNNINGIVEDVFIGKSDKLEGYEIYARTVFDYTFLPSTVRCSEAKKTFVEYTIKLDDTSTPTFKNQADDVTTDPNCRFSVISKRTEIS